MKKRICFVTTIASTLNFFPKHIELLQKSGATVELVSNFDLAGKELLSPMQQLNCVQHHIPFSRSPLSPENFNAYRELKQLLAEGQYDIVHTHTPNASAAVRLACRKLRRQGLKVFYTAHGFHFYDGAPLANWLLFYPVEWLCSRWTDVLITINREDHARAQKQFHAKQTVYIPGVGLDTAKFGCQDTREEKRRELSIHSDAKVLLTVGELNENKNQAVILRAMAKLNNPNLHYVLCGRGAQESSLRQLAEDLGLTGRVHLLGFRHDVPEIYPSADIYLCPSFREGLNVSIMEAMASGLPVICSDIRGNRDLVEQDKGGLLCRPADAEGFAAAIQSLLDAPETCRNMGKYNQIAVDHFSIQQVLGELQTIYNVSNDVE